MSKNKITIDEIVLTIGRSKVRLSVAEAKELQGVLRDLLGGDPTFYYGAPYWPYKRWTDPTVVWGPNTNSTEITLLANG
jgi:hypothetical protein